MPPNFLLALSILVQDTSTVPVLSPTVFQQADSIAAAEFAKDSLGSITVGIVAGPRLVWTKSYGYADRARTRLADQNTVYRVASITKQFTALMLLQLVERGKVRLSDRVDKYFPEIRTVRDSAAFGLSPTLMQLATMTSGLARDPNDKRRSQTGAPVRWKEALATALPNTHFVRAPGTGYGYSNIGYAILGAALSRAANEDYIAYQRRHVLDPLGMSSSSFELTPALKARLATGVDYDELYKDTLNYEDAADDHENGLGWGALSGGLYSTVGDIAKLIAVALGFGPSGVIRPETLTLQHNGIVIADPALDYGYGLGFQAYRWADTVAVGHSGNLAGYTPMVLYDTGRKYGVIVLRSAAGGNADSGRLAGRVYRKIRSLITARK